MTGADEAVAAQPFRWVVLAGASLLYICFGALMAVMAVLVLPISTDLVLDPFRVGTILAAWQLMYLVGSIPAGSIIDRFGLNPCLVAAALTMSLSAAMRTFAGSYPAMLAAMLVFGLSGPLITVGAPKLVSRWFAGAERGTAMGAFMASSSIGALLATVLTNSMLMPFFDHDWRRVLGAYTLFAALATAVWLVIVRHPANRRVDIEDTEAARARTRFVRAVLAGSQTRRILLMATVMFFFVHATHAWIPEILRARGLSPAAAGFWAGVPAIVSIVTGLVIPRLAPPEWRAAVLAAIALTGLVAAAALSIEPRLVLFLCLAGIGLPLNTLVPMAMLMLMEQQGIRGSELGLVSGLFFAAGQVGGVLGPLTSGFAIDVSGNYAAPLWLMSGAMLVLLVLLAGLRRRG